MRQKYQEKIIDSRAQNEPRKIFDIVNSVGGNSINSTTRTSISILSDTSGTLKKSFMCVSQPTVRLLRVWSEKGPGTRKGTELDPENRSGFNKNLPFFKIKKDSSSSQDEEDLINELIHLRAEADEVAPIGPNGPLPVIRVTAPTPMGSTVSLHKSTQHDPERIGSILSLHTHFISISCQYQT